MIFAIPHASGQGVVATSTVDTQELSVVAGGLQATLQANTDFKNFKAQSECYPDMRARIQGSGGVTATGSSV